MNLETIRQNLHKGGSAADAAIVEALKFFPEIHVKAHNDYGDGAIKGFFLSKSTGFPYVSFYSLGDGVDRDGSATLSAFLSAIRSGDSYTFSWEEERLRYTHMVHTSFGRECLDEAYRQAAEWLSDENIAKRARSDRMGPMFRKTWKLVINPLANDGYRHDPYDADSGQKWSNAYHAMNAAIEEHFETLEKMEEDDWAAALKKIFKRNWECDRDIPTDPSGDKQYNIALNL